MALSAEDVQSIVKGYNRGDGDSIAALAEANSCSDATIRYHLKKHGVLGADGPKVETDADLGIGVEDQPPASSRDISALMADPQFAKLIDAAVTARLAQNGAPQAALPQTNDMTAFIAQFARMIEVQSMQQPGYIKPLSAEEVDRRATGYIEMKALLADYEAKGTAPMYLLGDSFFECTNAAEYPAGATIRTFLPPAESFIPKNEAAEKVYAAMNQWIGGKTLPIGEQVEAAMIASKAAPLVTGAMNAQRGPGVVEMLDNPLEDMNRKRVTGTVVPERHGSGSNLQPNGPMFVGAEAA